MAESEDAPELDPLLQVLRAILVYGTLTFAAGFVFGVLRELALIPLLGRDAGRWIEFLIMIAATFATARIALRQIRTATGGAMLALGLGGTAFLLLLESTFALYVMRVALKTYLASFNVLDGELFAWGLAFMIAAPALVSHFRTGKE